MTEAEVAAASASVSLAAVKDTDCTSFSLSRLCGNSSDKLSMPEVLSLQIG